MTAERVIVIGAGIGGLAAGLRLAAQGFRVTVVERAAAPGGKMRRVAVGSGLLDAGPTVFTMRWVFDRLFAAIGESFDDHVRLRPAEVLARHAWRNSPVLDLYADIDRSADSIAAFAGPGEARNYRAFCAESAEIFRMLKDPFLCRPAPDVAGLVGAFGFGSLSAMSRLSPFNTMWRALGRRFGDPRLQQLFGRYATYCGSSPFAAPATLMLVAHVEQAGVWYVEGGMHALALALADLLAARGGSLRYEAHVDQITRAGGRVVGVRLDTGEHLEADAVVMNGDSAALAAGLLGNEVRRAVPAPPAGSRSLSAVTWLMEAKASGFPLLRHNVFFSDDYRREFDDLFERRRLPAAPTVYVCAQDRLEESDPVPEGAERLFCLVNAPAAGDRYAFQKAEIDACESQTFSLLRHCGLEIEQDPGKTQVVTPSDFHRLFPGTGGALYGRASHGWRAALQRPGCRTAIPGLYLAGGSVHPGPGVPMATLSGLMAAESLAADRASTRRFHPVAMSGGT
ncbi:MAG: phytoene desaturase family protein [Kiloniellales bacterium]|nr:phytoene desaturase family protein [Kiloniellales bacterium]